MCLAGFVGCTEESRTIVQHGEPLIIRREYRMIEQLVGMLHEKARNRLWLISDLQQSIPENATMCMKTAVDDFKRPALPVYFLSGRCSGRA